MKARLYNWFTSAILVAVISVPVFAQRDSNERSRKKRVQLVLVDKVNGNVNRDKPDRTRKLATSRPETRKAK